MVYVGEVPRFLPGIPWFLQQLRDTLPAVKQEIPAHSELPYIARTATLYACQLLGILDQHFNAVVTQNELADNKPQLRELLAWLRLGFDGRALSNFFEVSPCAEGLGIVMPWERQKVPLTRMGSFGNAHFIQFPIVTERNIPVAHLNVLLERFSNGFSPSGVAVRLHLPQGSDRLVVFDGFEVDGRQVMHYVRLDRVEPFAGSIHFSANPAERFTVAVKKSTVQRDEIIRQSGFGLARQLDGGGILVS